MKNFSRISLLTIVIISCNFSTADKKGEDDSLQYYPPTPVQISKDEFRNYYRRLSAFFDTILLNKGFNGGILVAKNGAVIYEKYQGRIDIRKKDTLTSSTPLHIASASKTFTGIAVLRLVQENKLSLNDSLEKFFPRFPYPGITIQMLLCHRSGLPNYLHFMSNLKWGILPNKKWNKKLASNNDVVKMMFDKKPDRAFAPGSRFNYCNTNYVLLALIIEKLTGKSYPEYMQQKFFAPLQMANTFVFTQKDTLTAVPSFTPTGVFWDYDFLDATYGDKNIYSTPQDLLKWDQALYTDHVIRPSLLDSAFAPYSFEKPSVHNYGMGWRLQFLPKGKKVIYHFGRWHGFNATFTRLTDEKATIIILGNKFTRSIYSAAHLCYDIFGDYQQRQVPDSDEIDSLKTSLLSTSGKNPVKKTNP
ncbi:MAG: serine hydrolase domain-containing protein [Bacteroidota bacterium]